MSIYQEEIKLRSKDVDMYRRLRVSNMFQMFQEASIRHTEELGMGKEKTLDKGILWIVTLQRCEIQRMPCYDETVHLKSWPGKTMHLFFPRYYQIEDIQGQTLIKASSLWMLADEESRKAVFPEEYGIHIEGTDCDCDIELPQRMPQLSGGQVSQITIPFSYIDLNRHVNHTRFFDLAQDYCLPEERNRTITQIQAEYSHEVSIEDALTLCHEHDDTGCSFEGSLNTIPCFRIRFTLDTSST
ncbi:MAG: hypothetical protein IJR58_02620 [Lachnospiraceae bacterium]|nr:hypothetical protein [Lachnospiraceae bacterium]